MLTQAVGAGGVAVGGNNTGAINTGSQTHINTGGGAYVGGNVNVSGGDFVGRDKMALHGMPADMASVLAALLQAVQRHAEPGTCPLAVEQVAAIEAEIAQPPAQRSEKRLARLLDGLADLVPGAISAVVSAFTAPMLATTVGSATAAVLTQLNKR